SGTTAAGSITVGCVCDSAVTAASMPAPPTRAWTTPAWRVSGRSDSTLRPGAARTRRGGRFMTRGLLLHGCERTREPDAASLRLAVESREIRLVLGQLLGRGLDDHQRRPRRIAKTGAERRDRDHGARHDDVDRERLLAARHCEIHVGEKA